MGEHGSESIHAYFNSLGRTYRDDSDTGVDGKAGHGHGHGHGYAMCTSLGACAYSIWHG